MGLKFIGERSTELLAWPEAERRRVFLEAVRRSYGRLWTWVGLVAFLTLTGCAHLLAGQVSILLNWEPAATGPTPTGALQTLITLCGWIILGMIQLAVIRKELREMRQSRQASAPVAESATPSP